MLIRGIAVVLFIAWLAPRWGVAPPSRARTDETAALRAIASVRYAIWDEDGTEAQRDTLYDALDELALAADPGLEATTLARVLGELTPVEVAVFELRDGERAIQWHVRERWTWDGGYRVSLLARRDGAWRKLGHVASAESVAGWNVTVRPDGILLLVWDSVANGWPPSTAQAVAIDGDHLVTASTGDVPRIEVGAAEIRVWRRIDGLNPYPDEPRRVSRWVLARDGAALISREESLSSWIDVLEAYCSGAHPELASADVIHRVERCNGNISSVRWTSSDEVVVGLPLLLWCPSEDEQWSDPRDGSLTLARTDDSWLVTQSSGCDD